MDAGATIASGRRRSGDQPGCLGVERSPPLVDDPPHSRSWRTVPSSMDDWPGSITTRVTTMMLSRSMNRLPGWDPDRLRRSRVPVTEREIPAQPASTPVAPPMISFTLTQKFSLSTRTSPRRRGGRSRRCRPDHLRPCRAPPPSRRELEDVVHEHSGPSDSIRTSRSTFQASRFQRRCPGGGWPKSGGRPRTPLPATSGRPAWRSDGLLLRGGIRGGIGGGIGLWL